jgi:hypothetical protein
MSAADLFLGFWWLIFPVLGFVFAGFGMWMHHNRSQRALDILKIYADQGKDPPPEVLRAVYGHADPAQGYGGPTGQGPVNPTPPNYASGPGYGSGWGGPWGWGGWGGPWSWRAYRWGPFWAWRRVFIFTSLAVGFGVAAWYEGGRDAEGFVIVTIIMSVLAVGALLTAIMQSMWKPK